MKISKSFINAILKKELNRVLPIEPTIYGTPEFFELLEKTIHPSSFICTYVAAAIKMLEPESVKIYGFSTAENPAAKYFVEENGENSDEGHHFAVMNDRYIVDPWFFDIFDRGVFDLSNSVDQTIIMYLYGDRRAWVDITSRVEPFEKLFPNTYTQLLKANQPMPIGVGTGRVVYDLGDGRVIKIAKNKRGIMQNKTEAFVYSSSFDKSIFPVICCVDPNLRYIICEKATVINEGTFQEIVGVGLSDFLYNVRFLKNLVTPNWLHVKTIDLITRFDLDRFDISSETSWGVVGERIVLLDYGLTLDSARKYYDVAY